MQAGLSEAQIDALDNYTTSEHFSAREKLVLDYADRITLSDRDADDTQFAQLTEEFAKPQEIVELTAIVAFETSGQNSIMRF